MDASHPFKGRPLFREEVSRRLRPRTAGIPVRYHPPSNWNQDSSGFCRRGEQKDANKVSTDRSFHSFTFLPILDLIGVVPGPSAKKKNPARPFFNFPAIFNLHDLWMLLKIFDRWFPQTFHNQLKPTNQAEIVLQPFFWGIVLPQFSVQLFTTFLFILKTWIWQFLFFEFWDSAQDYFRTKLSHWLGT